MGVLIKEDIAGYLLKSVTFSIAIGDSGNIFGHALSTVKLPRLPVKGTNAWTKDEIWNATNQNSILDL
jgi:hypothetical protein